MNPATLMVQGCTSDAGKSTLAAGLCRVFARRGVRVAPFKPQNMALNSAVTEDGGEIGRAQAVQARACGLLPHSDMNPVLLKPNNDVGAQVIVHGRAVANMDARDYHAYNSHAMEAVLASYRRLCARFEAIIVEGAGSPAEINLRDRDIANMGFAEAVDCPVVLVADIDRGGVFAHLVGTLELLSESERRRVRGFVINRFRGDLTLLESGLRWLEARSGKPVLGVLPYLHGLHLEQEDAIDHAQHVRPHALRVAVPLLPRISNHTDFDPLRLHPQVDLRFVGAGEAAALHCDLVILPGSKSVRADLAWLRRQGWEQALRRHLRYGGKVLGICGGYQILGRTVRDPWAIEGSAGEEAGFALLEVETELKPEKQLRNVHGALAFTEGRVRGYEIHAGVTTGAGCRRPFAHLAHGVDGALSEDGQVMGTYLHGLFEEPAACEALLRWAGLAEPETLDYPTRRDAELDRLADAVERHLDVEKIWKIAHGGEPTKG